MGQLSFLRLSAGTMPSFCKRSQSHGRRLKMLTGLGLCTWLLQRQRPLFPTQGWIINFFFGFHQSSSFSQEEELLGSRGLQPDILASDFFFFHRQNSYAENGFKRIVCSGFTWLAVSGDSERECSCRGCCKAPPVCICSCATQPRALGTPRKRSGFSKEHPNKNKWVALDVDQ